jgi:hypothetical protein
LLVQAGLYVHASAGGQAVGTPHCVASAGSASRALLRLLRWQAVVVLVHPVTLVGMPASSAISTSQPIFYPALNKECATKIARDWNVSAAGSGYVTRFEVRMSFLSNYEVHQVGGESILEYWIPAEDLAALNASIVGRIELVAEYH